MNRVLSNKRLYSASVSTASKTRVFGTDFAVGKNTAGHAGKTSLSVGIIFLIIVTIFLGGIYLFQVNKVATQGIDMREAENKIQEFDKENKQLKIKEIELKSMYNIEKTMENLNLVNSDNVSYVEMDGPVAMR